MVQVQLGPMFIFDYLLYLFCHLNLVYAEITEAPAGVCAQATERISSIRILLNEQREQRVCMAYGLFDKNGKKVDDPESILQRHDVCFPE